MKKPVFYHLITLLCASLMCMSCSDNDQTTGIDDAPDKEEQADVLFPYKGFSINNPRVSEIDQFCDFVENELVPLGVNLIVLRINYQYDFQTVDGMACSWGFPASSAAKLDAVCERNGILLVPHLELFGHQSAGSGSGFSSTALLANYPEFDESYGMAASSNYGYRSYCPLHPELHTVVYKMMDEMASAFKAKDFHIGCDEVMTMGLCDRCKEFLSKDGNTKGDLFAEEIQRLSGHLTASGYRTWMWGDRLINKADAKEFGVSSLTEWEASANGTYTAINRISKKIMICDWHYKGAPTTHLYFAKKGFDVISCFYNQLTPALNLVKNVYETRVNETDESIRDHCQGVMGTSWGGSVTDFMEEFQRVKAGTNTSKDTGAYVFYTVFNEIKQMEKEYENK
ncbi:MAG: family 20 glycosylhydrolase [Prevotella sp.]